ncbi:transposase [Alkaliphilus serpentinus]|uniref:Transposase n=1 Tax=Alkaliphilus serpentinus TaxID=1482731 RepID=A0A833HPG7_9FIRM|nr:transposase [Alkaliphilus serpentinus]KAB3529821.1 transposase [Alkaliphilus serpentinus]
MPRLARVKSNTGIYHIMVRGVNKQDIFKDDEDRERFLDTLLRFKKETMFNLYAYCLMNNHLHLLLKEDEVNISDIIKKISTSYVYYFNSKYERVGHLFQDRYKSEVVEDDKYFYSVIRYIHQNPIKARIANIEDFKWSSYKSYIYNEELIDTDFFLNMLATNREKAIVRYIDYMMEINNDRCMEIDEFSRLSDEKVKRHIIQLGNLKNIADIHKLEKIERNNLLRKAKALEKVSILQVSRITGINRRAIAKV